MAKIDEVRKVVAEFMKETLNVKEVKVIKVAKAQDGWDTEAEVREESSVLKSLGLPTRVPDKNIYIVKLDNDLDVQSYERKGEEKPSE